MAYQNRIIFEIIHPNFEESHVNYFFNAEEGDDEVPGLDPVREEHLWTEKVDNPNTELTQEQIETIRSIHPGFQGRTLSQLNDYMYAYATQPMPPLSAIDAVGEIYAAEPAGSMGAAEEPAGPMGAAEPAGPMGAAEEPAGSMGYEGPAGSMGYEGPAGSMGAAEPAGSMGYEGPAGTLGAARGSRVPILLLHNRMDKTITDKELTHVKELPNVVVIYMLKGSPPAFEGLKFISGIFPKEELGHLGMISVIYDTLKSTEKQRDKKKVEEETKLKGSIKKLVNVKQGASPLEKKITDFITIGFSMGKKSSKDFKTRTLELVDTLLLYKNPNITKKVRDFKETVTNNNFGDLDLLRQLNIDIQVDISEKTLTTVKHHVKPTTTGVVLMVQKSFYLPMKKCINKSKEFSLLVSNDAELADVKIEAELKGAESKAESKGAESKGGRRTRKRKTRRKPTQRKRR